MTEISYLFYLLWLETDSKSDELLILLLESLSQIHSGVEKFYIQPEKMAS